MEGESLRNGKKVEQMAATVHEVSDEPAVVIDGVPDFPPSSAVCSEVSSSSDEESVLDPFFGEWLEGRKVWKLFGDQYYAGKVVKYDAEMNWYRVVYEDGDLEDLEWHELEEVLLPLDVSVPLTTLALQRSKIGSSASRSNEKANKSKRSSDKDHKCEKILEKSQPNEEKRNMMEKSNFTGEKSQPSTIENKGGSLPQRTTLNMSMREEPYFEPEAQMDKCKEYNAKCREITQDLTEEEGAKLAEADVSRESITPESSNMRREIQKQKGKTGRAENQRRREKLPANFTYA